MRTRLIPPTRNRRVSGSARRLLPGSSSPSPASLDRSAYTAVGLIVVSLVLMTLDIRTSDTGLTASIRNTVQVAMGPFSAAVGSVVDPVVEFAGGLANLAGLRAENERLRSRISDLERDAAQVSHLEAEIGDLKTLLALRESEDITDLAIAVEITGRGGSLDPTLIISKGTTDGVNIGQPVVDEHGALVGRVSESGPTGARVVPITSRRASAVTVRLPDGQRGVVTGQGGGVLELSVLDADESLAGGELLVTYGPYGDSTAYPPDLDVGTVKEAAVPSYGVISVEVVPLGDFEQLRYVAVLPWSSDLTGADEEESGEGPTAEESFDAADGAAS